MTGLAVQPKSTLPPGLRPGAIGAWECRLPRNVLSWTDGVYDLFGLRRGSTIHRADTVDLYEERSRIEMNRLRSEAIATGRPFSLDCRLHAADGQRRWMRLVVGVEHRQGRPARIFGSKQDITSEKGLWADLLQMAEPKVLAPDALLQSFDEALRQFSDRAHGLDCALVIYAIDEHEELLASFGAAAAKSLSQHLAQRLARLFPDAVASGGLSEGAFAVLVPVSPDPERLVAALEGARRLLRRPVSDGAFVIDFKLSAGAATLSSTGSDPSRHRLMAGAEAGLKAARLTGGDRLRLFDGPMTNPALPGPSQVPFRHASA